MALADLRAVLPPPTNPVAGGDIDWAAVQAKYKIALPDDFRDLVSTYGSGAIDGFAWLLSPISANNNLNFSKSEYFLSSYAVMKKEFPSDYPRPLFPSRGSFFPWAVTDNGETFVWIVEGTPTEWKVAIHSANQSEEEVYSLGAVDFLTRLLRKNIESRILPSQFPSTKPRFSSAS
jgi:hypothetical protein